VITPGSFVPERHYYPRVLNAPMHPMVRFLFTMGNARIAERYCHMHPEANPEAVRRVLDEPTRFFRWGGADLFHVTTEQGVRRIVVIETNSCPSGQKSSPWLEETQEQNGYRRLIERSFLPMLKRRSLPRGGLSVLYDKNEMEVTGYASTLADLSGEPVYLVPCFEDDPNPSHRWTEDGVLEVRDEQGQWNPIRATLRYVTQRPWTRIPAVARTLVYNPVLACLSGGRNKMLAAKAYDLHNSKLEPDGLRIHAPETIWDVSLAEVPLWVARMGGVAVVKVPYSNAGQGVYTITSPQELEAFMGLKHHYDRFIVQALIGNSRWSSRSQHGRLYHVGTMPDKKCDIYVADLRVMVCASPEGFFPVAVYARRARKPLARDLEDGMSSWDMLGTNLSYKKEDGSWATQSERLLLMDSRDFNKVGVGLDGLIEGYLQTVLSMKAIDAMCEGLVTQKGRFRRRLFSSLNPDPALTGELMQ
jgi:hypothetical protein